MNSLKKIIVLLVLSVAIFSFNKFEKNESTLELNTKDLNVIEILAKQKNECRPSSDYLFYVESNLSNDRTPTITAKVYILERKTNAKSLLSEKKIIVSENKFNTLETPEFLKNGDQIIGDTSKDVYSFNELVNFEPIYNSYIKSTNKLLGLKRSL
ncbi:hypothetical protein [Polaribacter ponticola]|uniref:LPS export ABC transporter periplasmic protein LptC n=1 Tax=Polaribacter ponticola TaxID=2978475 RepID=A0ABT5SBR0_9FLAO|nr:hypothetical protein [Polaribacter sp. MSW5]MDD7915565.1 hypothetical protein [Polaribacter sp. MSW5]